MLYFSSFGYHRQDRLLFVQASLKRHSPVILNTMPQPHLLHERMLKARPSAPPALRIAITGFGPFPGVPFNASQRLIADLAEAPPRLPHGAQLYAAALPTDWRLGLEALAALLDSVRPHIALHFGVSARATGFAIETRAFNQTSDRPDCSGALAGER